MDCYTTQKEYSAHLRGHFGGACNPATYFDTESKEALRELKNKKKLMRLTESEREALLSFLEGGHRRND